MRAALLQERVGDDLLAVGAVDKVLESVVGGAEGALHRRGDNVRDFVLSGEVCAQVAALHETERRQIGVADGRVQGDVVEAFGVADEVD